MGGFRTYYVILYFDIEPKCGTLLGKMEKEGKTLLGRLLAEHDAGLQKNNDEVQVQAQKFQDEAKREASQRIETYVTLHKDYESLIVPLETKYMSEAVTSDIGKLFDDFKSQIYKRQGRSFERYESLDWGVKTEEVKNLEITPGETDLQWAEKMEKWQALLYERNIRWWKNILQMYNNNNNIHPASIKVVHQFDDETRKILSERKINHGNDTEVTYKFGHTELRFGWEKTNDIYKYFIGNNIHGSCNGREDELGELAMAMASILKNEHFTTNVFLTKKDSGIRTTQYSNRPDPNPYPDLGGTT